MTTKTKTTKTTRRARTTLTEAEATAAAERVNRDDLQISETLAEKIRAGCCVVKLRCNKLGQKRRLGTDEYDVDVAEDQKRKRTGATKRLFNHDSYARIASIHAEARSFLRLNEIACSVLGDGAYLVPLKYVPVIYERLTRLNEEHEEAVAAFVDAYDDIIAKEQAELGHLFRASDYPRREAVPARFEMLWMFTEFTVSNALRSVDATLYEAERRKFVEMWEADIETMRGALRVGFAQVVDAMVERLTVLPGEGTRVFRDSLVENMEVFLSMFDDKNLAGDRDLEALVVKAREVMAGVTPNDLRTMAPVREEVRAAMSTIASKLDAFVEVRQRKIVRVNAPTATAVNE